MSFSRTSCFLHDRLPIATDLFHNYPTPFPSYFYNVANIQPQISSYFFRNDNPEFFSYAIFILKVGL